MDLDKRIKNNHRPLCVIDIKWAMGFIGKNGFFADAINCFENLSVCQSGLLISVKDKKLHPFECDNQWHYTFFIPEEWIEPEEKKYRPYSLTEWINQHEIGDVIHYRSKSGEIELRQMYAGTRHSQGIKNIIVKITLGNESHTLDYLFENYEIEVNGEWHPFGIKE